MGHAGGFLRKNIRTANTPAGTKFSTIPVQAIRLGDRKLAFQLVIFKISHIIFERNPFSYTQMERQPVRLFQLTKLLPWTYLLLKKMSMMCPTRCSIAQVLICYVTDI